jgi:hypothetical protein
MTIFGRFVFGTLAVFFADLHYRHEIIPLARKKGWTRAQVLEAEIASAKRHFDTVWPEDGNT